MKKVFLTLIMIVGSVTTAQANDALCAAHASTAATIMSARQEGVPMADMLNILKGDFSAHTKDLYKKIIINAYSSPRFEIEKNQKKIIDDFRDKVHVDCLKDNLE
jgi:hypothetical protein